MLSAGRQVLVLKKCIYLLFKWITYTAEKKLPKSCFKHR